METGEARDVVVIDLDSHEGAATQATVAALGVDIAASVRFIGESLAAAITPFCAQVADAARFVGEQVARAMQPLVAALRTIVAVASGLRQSVRSLVGRRPEHVALAAPEWSRPVPTLHPKTLVPSSVQLLRFTLIPHAPSRTALSQP